MRVELRRAATEDIPALERLIARSARALAARDYPAEQIEAALTGAWGVDTQLIEDGTYLVGVAGSELVVCGGWSRRATPFGGDAYVEREARLLDPSRERARIRAFFVHPEWARQGLATRVLRICEAEARDAGFGATELVATRSGVPFYLRHGYVAQARVTAPLRDGLSIEFVSMQRTLA